MPLEGWMRLSLPLKLQQKACIEFICDGKGSLLVVVHRYGKSICYEALPFLFDK